MIGHLHAEIAHRPLEIRFAPRITDHKAGMIPPDTTAETSGRSDIAVIDQLKKAGICVDPYTEIVSGTVVDADILGAGSDLRPSVSCQDREHVVALSGYPERADELYDLSTGGAGPVGLHGHVDRDTLGIVHPMKRAASEIHERTAAAQIQAVARGEHHLVFASIVLHQSGLRKPQDHRRLDH